MTITNLDLCTQELVAKVKRVLSRKQVTRFAIYELFEQHVIESNANMTTTTVGELTMQDVKTLTWNYCARLAVELTKHGALSTVEGLLVCH